MSIDPTTFAQRLVNSPLNRVEGYRHGAKTMAYLRLCAEEAGVNIEHPEPDEKTLRAMGAAGHASWDKFKQHVAAWHDLGCAIPLRYADVIGVTKEHLLTMIAADREDHRRALATNPIIASWTLRRSAGVYELRGFPSTCETELDCIVYVGDCAARTGLFTAISLPGLKTLWFAPPEGEVTITLHEPQVRFTRTHIIFADDGRSVSTSCPALGAPVASGLPS